MTADQGDRIHRLTGEADGSEDNFTYVARLVLREERAAGWAEGYADAMHDQYESRRLAENREKRSADGGGGRPRVNPRLLTARDDAFALIASAIAALP